MKGSMHEDNFFIIHDFLVLMTAKETINWMRKNSYLHRWFLPLNGLQRWTPYTGCSYGNIPEFVSLDKCLNHEILYSLRVHNVLSRYSLDGNETNKNERNMWLSYSTPREISRELKHIWYSKMGTPSSVRIIEVVDLTLKPLEMFYRAKILAVEELADRNGHICKELGNVKSVSWGG